MTSQPEDGRAYTVPRESGYTAAVLAGEVMRLAVFMVVCGLFGCTGGPITQFPDDTGTTDTDSGDTDAPDGPDLDAPVAPLSDTCGEAVGAEPLGAGTYQGNIGGWGADELGSCLSYGAQGPEAFFAVDVAPLETLDLTYEAAANDGILYVLSGCAQTDPCLAARDLAGPSNPETVAWTNLGSETRRVYVALDTLNEQNLGAWDLEVGLSPYDGGGTVRVADDCAAAEAAGPLAPGAYDVDLFGGFNDVDTNACTGDSSGVDGIVQVDVGSGEVLEASWSSSCDPVLYVLETCGQPDTCLVGSDSFGTESVSWQNLSESPATVSLVLDGYYGGCSPSASDPGTLDLDVVPGPVVGADTCAAAEALDPVGDGFAGRVDLSGATATVQAGGSCDLADTTGDEVIVPVRVGANEIVTATFTPDAGTALLWLASDCADGETCLDGAEGTATWHNQTGTASTVYAVIDTDAADGAGAEPQGGVLTVEVDIPTLPTAETCGDVGSVDPVAAGTWRIDLDGATDDFDPYVAGTGGCIGWELQGTDVFVPVDLPPQTELIATYHGNDSTNGDVDVGLYLLDGCNAEDCLVGEEGNYSTPEVLTYINAAQAETLHLILGLDGYYGAPNRGSLQIELTPR